MKQGFRAIGTIVIIGGLLLVSIPLVRWGISSYHQRQALAAWEENMQETVEEKPVPVEEPVNEEPEPLVLPQEEALLEIPDINLKAVVLHGIDEETLKKGPGFYPQSTHPEAGNVSIAAHRGVYGAWFRHVDKLEPGDEIKLHIGGKTYTYAVREQFVTHNRDWSVVDSNDKAELTLTTCLFTTTTKRLIVKADLVDVQDQVELVME